MKYNLNDIEIFIPTYNRPEFLKESIKSLVTQTAGIPKITVFNNGPLKETSDVIASFAEYGVVEFKHQGGLIECMNKASGNLNSAFVMFFHDDDIVNCKYLEFALRAVNKYDDIAFITTQTNNFAKSDTIDFTPASEQHYLFNTQQQFAQYMYGNEKIAMQTAIYRSDLFKKFPREIDKYGKFFDWPYLVTLSNYGKVVLFSDEKMLYVRIHENQWTNDKNSSWDVESLTNWHKQFFDAMKADDIANISYYIFYSKFVNLFKSQYLALISEDKQKQITLDDAITYAYKAIGLDINDNLISNIKHISHINKILKSQNFIKDFDKTITKENKDWKTIIMGFILYDIFKGIQDNQIKEKESIQSINEKVSILSKGNESIQSINEKVSILSKGNESIQSMNEKINILTKENQDINNKLDTLINENNNIVAKIELLHSAIKKPTLLQQIFSIKNEQNHKVIRLLGFKIKIERKK